MTIGERIKKERIKKGLTQKQLGEKLGVSQAMIAQYENGTRIPKSGTAMKISNALEFSFIEWLSEVKSEVYYLEKIDNQKKENELLEDYRKLNSEGQKEAIKQINNLTKIKDYTKNL